MVEAYATKKSYQGDAGLNLVALANAGRNPALPLAIRVADTSLVIEQLLRTLPNQRYVGRACWQNRRVLAKVFVGPKASKHYYRELTGVNLLLTHAVTTPVLLAQEVTDEGGCLLFDYLEDSQTLDQQWQQVVHEPLLSPHQQRILQQALSAIAGLHLKGLWQQDLHLDNLLVKDNQVYWIDGDGITAEKVGVALSAEKIEANLAVFFAQLPLGVESFLPSLMDYYHNYNDTVQIDTARLKKAISNIRKWRVKDILKKVGRDCTLFSVKNTAQGFYGVLRTEEDTLMPLLNNPDQYIDQGRFIKGFGTTNVADSIVNGKHILLKRYNIKSIKHKLSRFWRPTRGWHSWQEGFRLLTLGIPTAKPLALIEERHLWMRGRAWLVTEYLDGPDLLSHFKQYEQTMPPEAELIALEQLFASLIATRISHGDLKGTNLFWVNNQWVLIDLDAVKQHSCRVSFKKAYQKDRSRFLRNWPKDTALYKLLDKRLPHVDKIA